MIASYCLYLLVQRKQEYAEFVADEFEAQRREYLYGLTENGQRVYGRALNDLSSFDVYVLDKLEASLTPSRTVDERMYADTLEIECFYKHFGLGLLKLRPASEWSNVAGNHYAYLYAPPQYETEVIGDPNRLRECFTEAGNNMLRVVHYQWHGYEHYEVVWCNAVARGFDDDVATGIRDAITETQLVVALAEEDKSTYRSLVMALVGMDEQRSDDESSSSSSSSSSERSSSSEDDAKKQQGALPPDVPTPTFAHRERTKFCASYNVASCCPHKPVPRSKEDDEKTEDSGAMTLIGWTLSEAENVQG